MTKALSPTPLLAACAATASAAPVVNWVTTNGDAELIDGGGPVSAKCDIGDWPAICTLGHIGRIQACELA